jgi:hypothetical protein
MMIAIERHAHIRFALPKQPQARSGIGGAIDGIDLPIGEGREFGPSQWGKRHGGGDSNLNDRVISAVTSYSTKLPTAPSDGPHESGIDRCCCCRIVDEERSYERLTEDGLTQWHPAFLALAATLELCALAYRRFCERYQAQPKSERRSRWGTKLLAKIKAEGKVKRKVSPGQKSLWEEWDESNEAIKKVAEKFKTANEFPPRLK